MLITPAYAHGLLGGEVGAHDGPLFLLAVLTVVVLLLILESKWRRRKGQRQNDGNASDQIDED